jgi:hypothetical protein
MKNLVAFFVVMVLGAAAFALPAQAQGYTFVKNGVRVQVTGPIGRFGLNGGVKLDISMNGKKLHWEQPYSGPTFENGKGTDYAYRFQAKPYTGQDGVVDGITVVDPTPGRQIVRIYLAKCSQSDAYTDCNVGGEVNAYYFYANADGINPAYVMSYDDTPQAYIYKHTGTAVTVIKTIVIRGTSKYKTVEAYLTSFVTKKCSADNPAPNVVVLLPDRSMANGNKAQRSPMPGQYIGFLDVHGKILSDTSIATRNSTLLQNCGE